MKFNQLKQYLTLVDEGEDSNVYEVPDGYALKVRPDRENVYFYIVGGPVVYPGGIDPDYETTEIKFYYIDGETEAEEVATFLGSEEDEIECDVEVYKRLD